ncbi:MAG: hypothetical protein WBM80_01345 [Woeseiaceae bacterium]
MKTRIAVVAALIFLSGAALSESASSPGAPPSWFLEEIATLCAGTGRWVTDNSEYKSEQEPYDAYGTEWLSSFDGTTMTGRLFGIKDNKETENFWEFRQYWHPERKEAVLEQFGWGGTIGIGTISHKGDSTRADQTFYAVDGTAFRSGHESSFPDPETYVTRSFLIDDGEWHPNRSYTWRRVSD